MTLEQIATKIAEQRRLVEALGLQDTSRLDEADKLRQSTRYEAEMMRLYVLVEEARKIALEEFRAAQDEEAVF